MKRRRRVLAETLIILASALVVLMLISSSPAEASGSGPVNPPIGSDPPAPISTQESGASSQLEQTSEPLLNDSVAIQPEESIDPAESQANNNAVSTPTTPPSQPPVSKPKPSQLPDDVSEAVSNVPLDYNGIISNGLTDAIPDSLCIPLNDGDEAIAAEKEQSDNSIPSEKGDVKKPVVRDSGEFEDEAEPMLDLDTEPETHDATEIEPLAEPQEMVEEKTVVKRLELKEEPKVRESSSQKKEKEKSLTTSSGIEVVDIKVSSHVDKVADEPITKFLFGMYTRLDSREDLKGVRKKIYQYIKEHPGEHMATLMKEFKLSPSSISHHINVLEKNGFIITHNDGRYKRLFVNGNGYISTVSDNYKCQISALKNENAKRIVFFLMARPASTQYELSNALDLHPSTIHWHAKKLMSLDLISALRDGKNIRYTVDDSICVLKVLSVVETIRV